MSKRDNLQKIESSVQRNYGKLVIMLIECKNILLEVENFEANVLKDNSDRRSNSDLISKNLLKLYVFLKRQLLKKQKIIKRK